MFEFLNANSSKNSFLYGGTDYAEIFVKLSSGQWRVFLALKNEYCVKILGKMVE